MNQKELRELDNWLYENIPGLPSNGRFTTDRAAAMEVLERCAENTAVSIFKNSNGQWCIESMECTSDVESKSLPLAICLFAKQLFTEENQ